jgi:hypothetical protein
MQLCPGRAPSAVARPSLLDASALGALCAASTLVTIAQLNWALDRLLERVHPRDRARRAGHARHRCKLCRDARAGGLAPEGRAEPTWQGLLAPAVCFVGETGEWPGVKPGRPPAITRAPRSPSSAGGRGAGSASAASSYAGSRGAGEGSCSRGASSHSQTRICRAPGCVSPPACPQLVTPLSEPLAQAAEVTDPPLKTERTDESSL